MDIKGLFDLGLMTKGLVDSPSKGGQSCGIIPSKMFVEFKPLSIRIEVESRSRLKSFELAIDLLKPVIDKYLKENY
jgi:hypothetical protein